jgi:hypothetical protein
MKTYLNFSLFIFLVGALILPCRQVRAQTLADTTNVIRGDTMDVACYQTGFSIRINALRDAVNSDTVTGGARKNVNRVYKLKTNGQYWLVDAITNSGFPLRIVADPMNSLGFSNYPPEIQMKASRPDLTSSSGSILSAGDDVTLKNIWINGSYVESGGQGAYQPVVFAANNHRYIIDGCVFERSNFSLVVFSGTGNECYVQNCKFRNLEETPPVQQWSGRGISIWADQDSVIIENNTFFNVGFTTFQMEGGSAKYLRYNHNTIANVGRGIMSNSGNWYQNAYFANNLVINGWWEGEGYADMHTAGRDARQTYSGLFGVGTLPAIYGTEQARRIVITKTYAYLDPLIKAKYRATGGADTITRAWFIDPVSVADYVTPYSLTSGGGHMVISDTNWLSSLPTGMTNYLTDVNWQQPRFSLTGATMVDSMWAFITQVRASSAYTTFFYHPETDYFLNTWPLPENFAYTDATLMTAGTDGLPIGDLNYFPTQKATFLANQTKNIADIEKLAGQVVIDSVKVKIEAENGGISGTSAVGTNQGFIYWNYANVGTLGWTFNVPSGKAGQYQAKWQINMQGNTGSIGMDFQVNGGRIGDINTYSWGGDPISDGANSASNGNIQWTKGVSSTGWQWMTMNPTNTVYASNDTVAFNLTAGSNTIGVFQSGGWGTLQIAEVDLARYNVAGTDTIKLTGATAVSTSATASAIGITWVASNFQYVSLGTAGKDTITAKADIGGTYKLRIFGQNLATTNAPIVISEAGTTLATANLPFKYQTGSTTKLDSTGNDVVSPTFTLAAGTHKLVLSGGGVNVDYIQLIKQDIKTGVAKDGLVPGTFALEQNYPNPFNPTTTINFSLAKASNVKLLVYNILGQQVRTLIDTRMNAGQQSVVFDASKLASGVYFYRLETGNFSSVKKMLLLK